ncbi:SHOCT domain-containing protein [Agromyces sp. CF514]|uniref:SHOCT domain-containing protein n=1 Tax=Agromyces sp. CF514 TaxID=1881031 RepID=UPI000B861410|nr:SHOCT domain-containing protein [Agromyces sp. CF514]
MFATVWDWIWFSFWIFAYVAYLFILIYIAVDIFRSRDIGGWMKALWIVLLVFLPFLTGVVYLIVRGQGMAERSAGTRPDIVEYSDDEVRKVSFANPSDEIAKAAALRDQGIITAGEFDAIKAKALGEKY